MASSTIIGLLLGAIIAQRFRAFAVIPLVAFTLAIVSIIASYGGETNWWTAGVAGVSVQMGYLCGAGLRFAFYQKSRHEKVDAD
jgi:hypothetical protein